MAKLFNRKKLRTSKDKSMVKKEPYPESENLKEMEAFKN